MDKFSELKAAAMAATPGPWILDDDSWSEGDNANVSTEERYDGRIVSIAQIEGGGSESGFDEPFSSEQQANARYIAAANPAVVLELLAELESKTDFSDKAIERISGLEKACDKYLRQTKKAERELLAAKERLAELEAEITNIVDSHAETVAELRAKLATPVRLPTAMFCPQEYIGSLLWSETESYNKAISKCGEAIRAAGFTVEGDDQ